MLCCICGIESTTTKCIRCSINIKTNKLIERIEHCKSCNRFLIPPKEWISCEFESKELLEILLKKSKYLKNCKIISAKFLPSEIHNKRIKIEIRYYGNLNICINDDNIYNSISDINHNIDDLNNTNTLIIIFTIQNRQCNDCQNYESKIYWTSNIQLRQKTGTRNLLQIQNEILQNKIPFNFLKEQKNGVDFYFTNKIMCKNFLNFLNTKIGLKNIESEKLISMDIKSNIKKSKLSYSVEIFPIDLYDFVILDSDFAKSKSISNKLITLKVTTNLQFIDETGKIFVIGNDSFWKNKDKFTVIKKSKDLIKYQVVEVEGSNMNNKSDDKKNKGNNRDFYITDVYITKDYSKIYHTKTYLGKYLSEGDYVWVYDMTNYNHPSWDNIGFQVFIIRKYYKEIKENLEYGLFMEDLEILKERSNGNDVFDKTNDLVKYIDGINL